MYIAYLDESGDSGSVAKSPTGHFVVGCVLIDARDWIAWLDHMKVWRAALRRSHGIPVAPELKASSGFLRGGGAFRPLGLSRLDRMELYADGLRHLSNGPFSKVFAIAIEKGQAAGKGWNDAWLPAWTFAMQRLDRFSTDSDERVLVVHDQGHDFLLKRLLRKTRRHQIIRGHFGGSLKIPSRRIVEDPVSRMSHDSYFIQVADWLAFAAHRSTYVDPKGPYSQGLWDLVAPVHLTEVNKVTGGPPGIVLYP